MVKTGESKSGRFRQVQLGNLELTILSDGYLIQTPVHPIIAPLATEEDVKKVLEENFRPTDHLDSALNVMLVKHAQRLILLDAGLGIFAQATQGWLLRSLAEAGFIPQDVTDVIVSHAHTDHIGGLVDTEKRLVFPNAQIHLSQIEYNFWSNATIQDFKDSPLYQMKDFVQQTIAEIQSVFEVIQSHIHFIDFEKGLYNIFSFETAPGHTPGHMVITIESKGERLVNIVDLVASDAILFAHPEWGFIGDHNIQHAVDTRIRILKHLSENKLKTFAFHLPYPGLGFVRRKGEAFEWVPQVFAIP